MPRGLKFKYADTEFECKLNKIDRRKLYGSVDVETRDINGNRCDLATLANDGKTLIPYGGTALGYIGKDGEWVERAELVPVDLSGNELSMLPSSFSVVIELQQRVSIEQFLDASSRLVYLLDTDEEIDPALVKELSEGSIFRFDFLYRESVAADPAFFLGTEDGLIWMVVGEPSSLEYVGLDQAAVCSVSEDKDEDEAVDEFDFEML